jgi:hypothetical protein
MAHIRALADAAERTATAAAHDHEVGRWRALQCSSDIGTPSHGIQMWVQCAYGALRMMIPYRASDTIRFSFSCDSPVSLFP